MSILQLEIREPNTVEEKQKGIMLRWYCLRKPLGLHLNSATDEFENQAYHLIAWLKTATGKKSMVGTGRLHVNQDNEAQIRYLAVAKSNRQQGIGRQLVHALEARAWQLRHQRVVVDVRVNAAPFYKTLGYQIIDGPFEKISGVQHYRMSVSLDAKKKKVAHL